MTTEPSQVSLQKKELRKHPHFMKQGTTTDLLSATYYEPITPIYFTTRLVRQESESYDVNRCMKEKKSVVSLFGVIPLLSFTTYKYVKDQASRTAYYCELTPDMLAWVETMKPYLQDVVRNRGKLNFRPTDDEINTKCDLTVYPFLVEYGGVTGIGWRRYPYADSIASA